jgi:hypothetical protein
MKFDVRNFYGKLPAHSGSRTMADFLQENCVRVYAARFMFVLPAPVVFLLFFPAFAKGLTAFLPDV